jgi:hypothetical protein
MRNLLPRKSNSPRRNGKLLKRRRNGLTRRARKGIKDQLVEGRQKRLKR